MDLSHIAGSSIVAAVADGSIRSKHGEWASAEECVALAFRVLQDSGALLAAYSEPIGRTGFRRVALSIPGTGKTLLIALDRDNVYIVRTEGGDGGSGLTTAEGSLASSSRSGSSS
jgi:hypothetical protein